MQAVEEFIKIESIFIRHRNCLLLRGQFTPIYTDYYLHLMQHKIQPPQALDQQLKDLLALFCLHIVARPWQETHAWTISLRAPRVNFFVTGSAVNEQITGRLFTEDVREPDRNYFYSQVLESTNTEARRSTLEVDGNCPLHWIEQYYTQSEQRSCRAFYLGDENFALITAQPGFDDEWFAQLNSEIVNAIPSKEETKILETRKFRFHCGCTLDRIFPILGSWKNRPDELFAGEDCIAITCPRCAAEYAISRQQFDSFVNRD